MKILKLTFILLISMGFLAGCQKELTFEANGISVGTFKKDAAGGCMPVYINSNFSVGTVLTNLDYVDVQVDVTVAGDFDIRSDTINGYSFRLTGTTYPGTNTIRLYPTGTPIAGGINTFTITYGTSTCTFDINVLGAGTPAAVFTLGGAGGNCTNVFLNGTYIINVPLTITNTARIDVNVISNGTYTISTTTVNGVSFSTTGVFSSTGPQTVILTGTGTPAATGTFSFPATGNANTCSFPVIFSAAVNTDYIPQTSYSNWSYRIVGGGPDDTSYVHILPTNITLLGNSYRIFETVNSINYPGVQKDSFYYRKNGGMYYHIYDDTYYFDNGFNVDGLILDSSLATGSSWIINLGANVWQGLPATGSIRATILAKGATAVIAGNSYSNIIKVEYIFRHNTGGGDVDHFRWETWYARGKGVIYDSSDHIPPTSFVEDEVTRVQVY